MNRKTRCKAERKSKIVFLCVNAVVAIATAFLLWTELGLTRAQAGEARPGSFRRRLIHVDDEAGPGEALCSITFAGERIVVLTEARFLDQV